MTIEREEIDELFTSLDNAALKIVRLLSLFTENQINTFPFRGSWTAAQIAEHVTRSNLAIVESLKSQGRISVRQPDQRVQQLREQLLNFDNKLESLTFILPTKDIYNKETVIHDLESSVGQLIKVGRAVNLFEALNHPIFGDITRLELLHFVLYHTQRHTHQLERIFELTSNEYVSTGQRKIISFMHVSLDGFVAGLNGEMNWITMDDEIFEDAIALANTTDTALYGRTTYEMMESYWPSVLKNAEATKNEVDHATWVQNVKKIVFSTSLEKAKWNNTTLVKKNIGEEVIRLKRQPGRNMMIFGSPRLTQSFIEMGVINEYRMNVNPVVLGSGIPLFMNVGDRINLKLVKAKTFESGVIGLHYETKQGN